MNWNDPIDLEAVFTAYGIYSDTGNIYKTEFGIYEDFHYDTDFRPYTIFGEERSDEISFLAWAEVWAYNDDFNAYATICQMRAHYDADKDKIIAYFDDERREYDPSIDLWKEWVKYRTSKVKAVIKDWQTFHKFFKENTMMDWELYTDKKEAERESFRYRLFVDSIRMAARELNEDEFELMSALGLI